MFAGWLFESRNCSWAVCTFLFRLYVKSNVYVHSPALHACPARYSPLSVTVGLVGAP